MHTPACHPHHQIHSESKWTRGCGLLWKPFQAWTDHVKCQHPCSSLPRQTPRGPANWVHWHKSYIGQMPWKTSGKGCIQIIPSKPNRWSHCFLKNISNASSNMQMPGWTQCLMVLGARNRKIEFDFCYSSYEAVPFQFWTKPPPHANKPVLDKLPVESLVTGCLPVACTKRLPVMPPCRFCLAAMRDWGDSSPAIKSNAEAIITKVDHQFWTPKARNRLGTSLESWPKSRHLANQLQLLHDVFFSSTPLWNLMRNSFASTGMSWKMSASSPSWIDRVIIAFLPPFCTFFSCAIWTASVLPENPGITRGPGKHQRQTFVLSLTCPLTKWFQ